jgi:hypothetical protein
LLNPLRQAQPREVIGHFKFEANDLGHIGGPEKFSLD